MCSTHMSPGEVTNLFIVPVIGNRRISRGFQEDFRRKWHFAQESKDRKRQRFELLGEGGNASLLVTKKNMDKRLVVEINGAVLYRKRRWVRATHKCPSTTFGALALISIKPVGLILIYSTPCLEITFTA